MVVLPLVLLFTYISHDIINPLLHEGKTPKDFWVMTVQAFVLCQVIILYEIIRLYIKHAINEAREKEQIKKELMTAQYEGLKSQVNPHFLFNSSSVLSSLVEKNSEDAVEFIGKLSDLYRYILENDEKSLVSIKNELSFVDDYVYLLQMRHRSALSVVKDLDRLDEDLKVPPLSLQTLIENAVKHNSFSKDEPLEIKIFVSGDKSIQVENRKIEKAALVKSTGIGLKNLSKRLKLLTGKGLTITENEEYFKVGFNLI